MRRARPLLAAAAAVALLAGLAACGDDDTARVDESVTAPARGPGASDGAPSTAAPGGTSTSTSVVATSEAPSSTRPSSTSPPSPPPTTPPPPPTTPTPPFESSVEAVTAEQLGVSWRPGCPVGPEQLRAINVSHWGYDGAVHTGRLIVAATDAEQMVAAFRDLYAARFPVQQIVPVDRYDADDQASMRANNTSGYNCRYVAGTTRWSEHSYGRAVDVNPLVNPYVKGGSVDPPEGAPYADRSRTDAGMIHSDDAAVRAFAAQGWKWGGYWSSGKDYQHFSASGR
jgi:hypothetical protein